MVDRRRLVGIFPASRREPYGPLGSVCVNGIKVMFAVIKTGGKQYKVAPNDVIRVEKLPGQAGDTVTLDQVLMDDDNVGAPTVACASVTATLLEQTRGEKVIIFKKKRRQNYRRKKGHRQELTVLRITGIAGV